MIFLRWVSICSLLIQVGCSSLYGPPGGVLFSKIRGPVAVTAEASKSGYNGRGESKAFTILYVFTIGDASINRAKQNGSTHPELVRVTHVDYEWNHFLGIGTYKTIVYFHDPAKDLEPHAQNK